VDDGALPDYDSLPIDSSRPPGSAWGVWGDDDVFGCLNLLTPDRVRRAAGLVRTGAVFALNLDMGLPEPPLFGRPAFSHEVTGLGGRAHDDLLHGWNTQSSSQWDGFRHVGSVHGYWNGVDFDDHGMHHWAGRGLAGRAVLADVARWREAQGRPVRCDESDPIEVDDLHATLASQGTVVEEGDILLVRTGWLTWYRGLSSEQRAALADDLRAPGLRPGRDTARGLWDLHIAAIGCDNPAVEVWPPGVFATPEQLAVARDDPEVGPEVFVHLSLLPLLGLPLGELWDLDRLAEDCAADGVYECFFTSAPLHLRDGVASPPNAIAIK
jgi:kynurenine formamidase